MKWLAITFVAALLLAAGVALFRFLDLSELPQEEPLVALPVSTGVPLPIETLPTPPVDSVEVRIAGQLPEGAQVLVDGRPVVGSSVALVPGRHMFTATAPGFAPDSEEVDVAAGKPTMWSPQLEASREAQPTPSSLPAATRRKTALRVRPAPLEHEPAARMDDGTPTSACSAAYQAGNWAAALSACIDEAVDGSVVGYRTLGLIYGHGLGIVPDHARAAEWFRKAAEAGDGIAQYELGLLYENGYGVAQDPAQAVRWLQQSAAQGHVAAQVRLGYLYADGVGVQQSDSVAVMWFRKAANLGSQDARRELKERGVLP